jgi:hypothetical protein
VTDDILLFIYGLTFISIYIKIGIKKSQYEDLDRLTFYDKKEDDQAQSVLILSSDPSLIIK